jgi:hypothetical protein
MTEEIVNELAKFIADEIRADFEIVFLSGNLRDTIYLEKLSNGFKIVVDAERYDIAQYTDKKVIVYTGEGSYASEVDETGGFSYQRVHKNYISRAIQSGIDKWMKKNGFEGKVYDR